MQVILDQLQEVGFAQWMATLFSIIYILLAVRNKSSCFIFGLISAVFWGYESYVNLNLKYDALLQMFYVLMSIWGIYQWRKGGDNENERPISALGVKGNVLWIGIGIITSIFIYYLLLNLVSSEKAFLDLATTVFSVIATFLLIYRFLDQWIYWIVIDLCYVYIYSTTGGELFAIIMLVYTILAFQGFFSWKKLYLEKI